MSLKLTQLERPCPRIHQSVKDFFPDVSTLEPPIYLVAIKSAVTGDTLTRLSGIYHSIVEIERDLFDSSRTGMFAPDEVLVTNIITGTRIVGVINKVKKIRLGGLAVTTPQNFTWYLLPHASGVSQEYPHLAIFTLVDPSCDQHMVIGHLVNSEIGFSLDDKLFITDALNDARYHILQDMHRRGWITITSPKQSLHQIRV